MVFFPVRWILFEYLGTFFYIHNMKHAFYTHYITKFQFMPTKEILVANMRLILGLNWIRLVRRGTFHINTFWLDNIRPTYLMIVLVVSCEVCRKWGRVTDLRQSGSGRHKMGQPRAKFRLPDVPNRALHGWRQCLSFTIMPCASICF